VSIENKYTFQSDEYRPQTMDIVDMEIHRVVRQKSDFHGNSDFQNSQKLDPLQITAKKCQPKIC
jgi:hypothetical protein